MPEISANPEIAKSNRSISLMKGATGIIPADGNQTFRVPTNGERWIVSSFPNFPTQSTRNASMLLQAFDIGNQYISKLDRPSGEESFEPALAVSPESYHEVQYMPPAAYYRAARALGISVTFLQELALEPSDKVITKRGGRQNEVAFVGTAAEYMTFIGIEERSHAGFYIKHFGDSYPPAFYAREQRRVEYDAQPHELAALVDVLVYARANKYNPQEIALLETRVREARDYKFTPDTIASYQDKGFDLVSLFEQVRQRTYEVVPQ